MATINILIADDHPVVRDGLVAILTTQTDFEVVGEAGNGTEAVAQVQALQPDVLLLDLEMPELDGVGGPGLSHMR
jgi:DNA-binding NarL/FixJ family response regulator